MGVWDENAFFINVKGHVIKGWQQHIQPILRIDNNRVPGEQLNLTSASEDPLSGRAQNIVSEASEKTGGMENGVDPMEIMRRIENERKQKELKDLSDARKKVAESEKIDAIMQANKVDITAFIEEGKMLQNGGGDLDEETVKKENLRRAQEILDRLNREASEDDAKLQSEIEEAKKVAKEKFGD